MARRDIPEINAGSMADIAFLLLIFFLVTTTMDRDQAYKRRIPKKIERTTPPPPVEKRNIFSILANANGEVFIENRVGRLTDLDELSDKVKEFYTMNENLSPAQTEVAAASPSHPGYNFPLYSRITMPEIEKAITTAEDDLEATEAIENADPNIIDFKTQVVQEWMAKKRALQLYGKSYLPEIQYQAHIRIKVQKTTTYEVFTKIQSELEEAIYDLRDEAAQNIFNESYGSITRRYDNDQKKEDADKIALLELLYPDRFIEVKPN